MEYLITMNIRKYCLLIRNELSMVVHACSPSVGKADRRILGLGLPESAIPTGSTERLFPDCHGHLHTRVCASMNTLTPQVHTDAHVHTRKYTQNIDI